MNLNAALQDSLFLREPIRFQAKQFLIGYSGGLDSTVLLHFFAHFTKFPVTAVHVNHHLQNAADSWALQCKEMCEQWHIPFKLLDIDVEKNSSLGLEASARKARYQAIATLMTAETIFLTAHHAQDQAETVLLNLLRGSGVRGLAGMPSERSFASGLLMRPLLTIPRALLQSYAQEHQLSFVEDPSNTNTDFKRNFLRQIIMPQLESRFTRASESIVRAATHCLEATLLLETQGRLESANVIEGDKLLLTPLQSFSLEAQQRILREWFARLHQAFPTQSTLLQIIREVIGAKIDANPQLRVGDVIIRRFHQHLFMEPQVSTWDSSLRLMWNDYQQPLSLTKDAGSLQATIQLGSGLRVSDLKDPLEIRFRVGGEMFFTKGHHAHLKKLWQEWQIPPWQRSRIPLIYHAGQLVCVPGYAVSDDLKTKPGEPGLVITHV